MANFSCPFSFYYKCNLWSKEQTYRLVWISLAFSFYLVHWFLSSVAQIRHCFCAEKSIQILRATSASVPLSQHLLSFSMLVSIFFSEAFALLAHWCDEAKLLHFWRLYFWSFRAAYLGANFTFSLTRATHWSNLSFEI